MVNEKLQTATKTKENKDDNIQKQFKGLSTVFTSLSLTGCQHQQRQTSSPPIQRQLINNYSISKDTLKEEENTDSEDLCDFNSSFKQRDYEDIHLIERGMPKNDPLDRKTNQKLEGVRNATTDVITLNEQTTTNMLKQHNHSSFSIGLFSNTQTVESGYSSLPPSNYDDPFSFVLSPITAMNCNNDCEQSTDFFMFNNAELTYPSPSPGFWCQETTTTPPTQLTTTLPSNINGHSEFSSAHSPNFSSNQSSSSNLSSPLFYYPANIGGITGGVIQTGLVHTPAAPITPTPPAFAAGALPMPPYESEPAQPLQSADTPTQLQQQKSNSVKGLLLQKLSFKKQHDLNSEPQDCIIKSNQLINRVREGKYKNIVKVLKNAPHQYRPNPSSQPCTTQPAASFYCSSGYSSDSSPSSHSVTLPNTTVSLNTNGYVATTTASTLKPTATSTQNAASTSNCDINFFNNLGESALSVAVQKGHDAAVRLLLQWGADPSAIAGHCAQVSSVMGASTYGTNAMHLAAAQPDSKKPLWTIIIKHLQSKAQAGDVVWAAKLDTCLRQADFIGCTPIDYLMKDLKRIEIALESASNNENTIKILKTDQAQLTAVLNMADEIRKKPFLLPNQ